MCKYILWMNTGVVARVALWLLRIAFGRLGLVYVHHPHTWKCDSSFLIRYSPLSNVTVIVSLLRCWVLTSFLTIIFWIQLQQRTRIERVIGFVLAIWGILFYSRLLSTMTEQFRVRSYKICVFLELSRSHTPDKNFNSIICTDSEKGHKCKF